MTASRPMPRGARARAFTVCLGLLAAAGCFYVDVHAPLGKDIYLLAAEDAVEVKKPYHTWYTIFGWFSLDDRMPDTVIDAEYLSEVRVAYQGTLEDALISFFNSILVATGILPQTLVVEGNRSPGWQERLR